MAVLKIFGVRDRAVDSFGQPIFAVAAGAVVRSFTDEIQKDGTEFNRHPDDYDLYELGEFEQSTGVFTTHEPRMIAIGKSLVSSSF